MSAPPAPALTPAEQRGVVARSSSKPRLPRFSSSPPPFGTPLRSRPIGGNTHTFDFDRTSEDDDDYGKRMEATLSSMIAEHDKDAGKCSTPSLIPIAAPASCPFGTPLKSRPLCGIYSSKK